MSWLTSDTFNKMLQFPFNDIEYFGYDNRCHCKKIYKSENQSIVALTLMTNIDSYKLFSHWRKLIS